MARKPSTNTRGGGRHFDRINLKQERFCCEYVVDGQATRAAKAAGYSPNSAHVSGCNLLKQDKIKRRIAELERARTKRTEVSADRIIYEFGRIAFSNLKNYEEALSHKKLSELLGVLSIDDAACIQQIDSHVIQSSGRGKKKQKYIKHTLKFYDKLKALDSLARIKGMFKDGDATGDDRTGVCINDLNLSLDDKKKLLKALRAAKEEKQTLTDDK